MNKVVSMNLNGNAYQLDEPGYAALSAYLTQAKAQLADNPDKDEILADLEQAIADKLSRFLSAHKSVVTEDEVQTVIKEMGPVGGVEGEEKAARQTTGPKRLYRIPEGEILGGVATGLAAYFNVDVTLIRIIMIVLLLITGGGFAFGYILAWIFIPLAVTQEEQAKAYGEPFNAEEIIARTKAAVERGRDEGMKHWKAWQQQNRAARKAERRAWKQAYKWQQRSAYDYRYHHSSFLGQLFGLLVFSFVIWLGYHHIPEVQHFLDSIWGLLWHISDWFAQQIVALQN